MKFSLFVMAAGLIVSLAACNHDSSSTEAAPSAAVNPQNLPSVDSQGTAINGTALWTGQGRRACMAEDRELVRNIHHDLRGVEADAQVGWAQGASGRISYLILAAHRLELGISECNRAKAEIQFSNCQLAEVNHSYEALSRECDSAWEQHGRIVELLKKFNVEM